MMVSAKIYFVLVMFALIALSVSPAAGQAAQNTFLTVQTDEAVLGRVVSISEIPEIAQYSVTITRGMSVQPAKVGDTLLHGDIITLQRGAFANIQLVDRADVTLLGGGTDGLAARITRTGAAAVTKITQVATTSPLYAIQSGYNPGERGRVTFVQGKAYILRSGRIIPASVGEGLLCGDTVSADAGSSVTIETEGKGIMKISENARFDVLCESDPDEEHGGLLGEVNSFLGSLQVTMDNLWMHVKEILRGDSFKAKADEATAGVRG
jgi:hypothetical protein